MNARRTALPSWHRWSLWAALVVLLACMLATLVWLAGRHEAGQIQERLGRDAATAIADIRFALARDQQSLAVLGSGAAPNAAWQEQASALLQAQRALVRIEWRDADLHITAQAQTPYHPIDWNAAIRADPHDSAAMACANARRLTAPAYAGSYFQPYSDGLGAELLELCLPLAANGRMEGFIVATYALQDLLSTTTSHNLAGNQEVSFTDPDGTRLALIGATQRGARLFTTQQLHGAGVSMIIYPVSLQRQALGAMERLLTTIREDGTQQAQVENMLTRKRLYELVDYNGYNQFDSGVFNFEVPETPDA